MYTYYPKCVTQTLKEVLPEITLHQHDVKVFGKTYPQPRLTAWYGPVDYTYSRLTLPAQKLPFVLEDIKQRMEEISGSLFNSVLVNFYRHGGDKIGWHADDEPVFGVDPVIASVSFGSTRTFKFRRKLDHTEKMSLDLEDQSGLIMPAGMQKVWEHSLPPRKKILTPRLNLTFRHIDV
jgi:alkylated DNA repair dioxygenase AlkB